MNISKTLIGDGYSSNQRSRFSIIIIRDTTSVNQFVRFKLRQLIHQRIEKVRQGEAQVYLMNELILIFLTSNLTSCQAADQPACCHPAYQGRLFAR